MSRYPKIKVKLVGQDGNAFAIMGRVVSAMKKAKLTSEQIEEYRKEAMSGDYNNLLHVTAEYVSVS